MPGDVDVNQVGVTKKGTLSFFKVVTPKYRILRDGALSLMMALIADGIAITGASTWVKLSAIAFLIDIFMVPNVDTRD